MIREPQRQGLTVVIVGDEGDIVRPLAGVLESAHYRVLTTNREHCVAEITAAAEAHAVIVALATPFADALRFCRELKNSAEFDPPPVLLARAAEELDNFSPREAQDEAQAPATEIDDFLSLPVDREEVLVKVARLTERHRVEQGYRRRAVVPDVGVDQYRLLFENSPLPMWVYDLETLAFLAVNEAAVRHYSYTRDEFLRMTIKDIRPPEDVPALMAHIEHIKTGWNATSTWQHRQKNGRLIDVEITSHELIFRGRRARLVLANDVTERKQADKIIVGAKEEWETTFNAMSDAVLIFDENGDLTRVNRAGAALEDTTPEKLVGRHCCQILHAAPSDCIVTRCLIEKRRLTDEISLPHLRRSLLFTCEPITAADGRIVGAVCSVRDLSELRKIEAVAREHQSLLRSVLDSAREAIYALDTDGRLQWCNKGVVGLGGYAPEDLIGRSFLQWTRPEEHRRLQERFDLALGGEPQSFEMSYFGSDGQPRCAMVDHSPLVIDGRTTGVLGIARDITELKAERERAAQADKLRALGQLASGVAHDFNNALAAIIGRAQLLSRLIQDATLATHLDVIQTAAADAAATVRRIQTFARQPRVQEFELLNAETLLRDAIELTRTRWESEARARELRYDVRLDADDEIYIEGTASELREVFVNLIVNAIDAMPDGGALRILCRRAGDRIQLVFADTGQGMSEEVRRRIFEPFYTTKGAQGTGLGLFVSYGIIERHRGVINVESDPAQAGTTFVIELPAIEAAMPRLPRVANNFAKDRRLSVLVVDDEAYVRETLAEFVVILGHRVVKADGGRAALAAVTVEAFDVVLLDLTMPGANGWEVAREIRRHRPRARIILTTGYSQEKAAPPAGEQHTVDAFITKPFTFGQIAELIARVTGDAPQHHEEIEQKAG